MITLTSEAISKTLVYITDNSHMKLTRTYYKPFCFWYSGCVWSFNCNQKLKILAILYFCIHLYLCERTLIKKTEFASPGADPHKGDGGTGEEDRHEEEGLPAPDVRQGTNQRSWEKRQETLNRKGRHKLKGPWSPKAFQAELWHLWKSFLGLDICWKSSASASWHLKDSSAVKTYYYLKTDILVLQILHTQLNMTKLKKQTHWWCRTAKQLLLSNIIWISNNYENQCLAL